MIRRILIGAWLIFATSITFAEEPDQAIHEELRSVMNTLASAINSGEFDKMLPVLSEQIRATPINQEFLKVAPTSRPISRNGSGPEVI